jgi:uncharacterized membrane protein
MRLSVLRPAFVAASIAWPFALVFAPWVAGRASAPPAAAVAFAVYAIGHAICHQLPERSFRLFAAQMPVCARCTGIYIGAALAATAAAALNRRTPAGVRAVRLLLTAAAVPTALTLAFEWTTGITPSNTIRFLAGAPIGAAIAWLVVPALAER